MRNIITWGGHLFDWPHPFPLRSLRRMQGEQTAGQKETRQMHQAFDRAYGRFARAHPAWVARRFDKHFLRQAAFKRPVRSRVVGGAATCPATAQALALAWDAEFGMLAANEAARTQRFAELILAAHCFLALFVHELAQDAATAANG